MTDRKKEAPVGHPPSNSGILDWVADRKLAMLVDGRIETLESGLCVDDPSTGTPLGWIGAGDRTAVAHAVRSAADALPAWQATAPEERGAILAAFADGIRERQVMLTELVTRESGKPWSQSVLEARAAEQVVRFFAGLADKVGGRELPGPMDIHSFTRREAVGVTAHITPWNFPLTIPARSVAAAVATGNTAVVKPSEEAPFSALLLAEIANEAGLPRGVLNLVAGAGPETGACLVEAADVQAVAFTGSVATGRVVGETAGRRLIPASLELGGKAPNIVFADADLDRAIDGAVFGIIRNAGQSCLAGSRLLVQKDIFPTFVDRLTERLDGVTIGPGLDDPDMGPLVSQRQLDVVERYVALGKQEGRMLCGGTRVYPAGSPPGGWYFAPTAFTDLRPDARLAQEEVFGPVLCIFPFADEREAVELANGVQFGLGAGLWTSDLDRAMRLCRALQAGSVFVNEYPLLPHHAPHGGYKDSGLGREKGLEAIHNYTQTKHVSIRIAPTDPNPSGPRGGHEQEEGT